MSRLLLIRAGGIAACLLPAVLLGLAFFAVSRLGEQLRIQDLYQRHRAFWGGAPAEVFSHWLNLVMMSGNALALAWLLTLRTLLPTRGLVTMARLAAPWGAVLAFLVGVALDRQHGEGTVLMAGTVLFLPMLVSSHYVLFQLAALARWKPARVAALSAGYAVLHLLAQLKFEPSETGGPNSLVLVFWLFWNATAVVWAFVNGVRRGSIRRTLITVFDGGRKRVVWMPVTCLVLVTFVSVTTHAWRLHAAYSPAALQRLDALEAGLTENVLAGLKQATLTAAAKEGRPLPMPESASALLRDTAVSPTNDVRVYVPLADDQYHFLWVDATGPHYSDVRRMRGDHTVEIHQAFIDAVMDSGGTHETGLYAMLWSPYLAGRVLKNTNGHVKAICILSPR